ncbi:hypothetical protein, partial [Klebsiella pneumoniae]|uniref:hypothetical protein n=1 Tax=Klebsiella pneumoniae TaxID=573 RepID=UPI0022B71815
LKLYQHYLNTSIYHRGSTLGDPPSPIFQDKYSLGYQTNRGEVQLGFFEFNLLPEYNQDEYTIQLPEGNGYVYFTCWIYG